MAGPGIAAPSEGEVVISDAYLNDNAADPSVEIDLVRLTPNAAFESTNLPRNNGIIPRGVAINEHKDDTAQSEASDATINRKVANGAIFFKARYTCRIIHPDRITKIRPYMTSARGILIKY